MVVGMPSMQEFLVGLCTVRALVSCSLEPIELCVCVS